MSTTKSKTPDEILIPEVDENKPLELYQGDRINLLLKQVEEEVSTLVLDPSDPKEYKHFGSVARRISSFKVTVDNMGKGLVEPLKKQCKEIDAARKVVKDRMDKLRSDFLKPREEFDAKEEARVKQVADAFDLFQYGHLKIGEFRKPDAAAWEALAKKVEEYEVIEEVFREKTNEAKQLQGMAIENIKLAYGKWKEDEAALEAGRKALQEKQDREAAERHAKRLEEQAKAAEAKKEAQAKAPESGEKPRPLTLQERQAVVHRNVAAGLMAHAGLDEEQAKKVVREIYKRSIPYVTITYPETL